MHPMPCCCADALHCLAGAVGVGAVMFGRHMRHDVLGHEVLGQGGLGGLVYQARNRLTPQQRAEAVDRLRAGESRRALALEYNVHPVTLWRLNKKRDDLA